MTKILEFLQNSLESACLHPNRTRLKSSFPSFARYLLIVLLSSLLIHANTDDFTNCTEKEIDILNLAYSNAIELTKESLTALNSVSSNMARERYSTWFGSNNSMRNLTVRKNFQAVYTTLMNQSIKFNCVCNKEDSSDSYAYTDTSSEINICPLFWTLSKEGKKSQAGTILHEVSHFQEVAGTFDIKYEHSSVQTLAKDNAMLAIKNASSYQYFAENTPFLRINDCFFDINDVNKEYQKNSICHIKNIGIVAGYSDGTYKPRINITRAEFLKIILEADSHYFNKSIDFLNKNFPTSIINKFSDVKNKDEYWFKQYVWFAISENIIDGYSDGTFKPNNHINFAEASKIIAKTFELKDPEEKQVSEEWFATFIRAVNHVAPNTYSSTHKVTRGEMAYLISSVLNWEGKQ